MKHLVIVHYPRHHDVYRRTGEIGLAPVVTAATRRHERRAARIGVSCHTCSFRGTDYKPSFARTAKALIEDVHSIMDAWPRHELWEISY